MRGKSSMEVYGQPVTEIYDLLILVDATSSMSSYLKSLRVSLPKVIAISNITSSFSRIGLLAYRDYSEAYQGKNGLLEWSGWYDRENIGATTGTITAEALMKAASSLEANGGGDMPEATKTGLASAHALMRENATTIILLYTDAPPHCYMVSGEPGSDHHGKEQKALKVSPYQGYGPQFMDWVSACRQFESGPRKAHVMCFLDKQIGGYALHSGYYTYLSTVTQGACFTMTNSEPRSIAQVTVDVLLAWMEAGKAGAENVRLPAIMRQYRDGREIWRIRDERDKAANSYFWAWSSDEKTSFRVSYKAREEVSQQLTSNIVEEHVDSDVLHKHLPKRATPVADFAQRYYQDEQYKKVVVDQLKMIIISDVTSMSLNPVFGTLWRAVCNDRANPARDELLTLFSLHVSKIANQEEKTWMKKWLEESYDHAADILEALRKVPEQQRFPCVFLDPTIDFTNATLATSKGDDEGNGEDRPITLFTRDELLEIGRSCDGRILRRLGKVLTRITYVESADQLPAHIAATDDSQVPKMPLALATAQHGWKFWKMLLHVVLPGTMLSARPSVVLAALAIRIAIRPLFEPACKAMMFWRDKWNDLDVPETWNSSCLGLLLDADKEHRKQLKEKTDLEIGKDEGLLLDKDRALFQCLVDYKMAEANLLTTLSADVGWTPKKTQMPIGYVIRCSNCEYPRSITIMAEGSGTHCGFCLVKNHSWKNEEHKQRYMTANVHKDDNRETTATWVECSVRTCRAQYVCYNVDALTGRPKCHFCRLYSQDQGHDPDSAHTLECTTCLSKVVWPPKWQHLAPSPFQCVACISGRQTIVSVETNAQQLCNENGRDWLLQNKDNTIEEPFNKRSVFHTVSKTGTEAFAANVQVLPTLPSNSTLQWHGKLIRNQVQLKSQLSSWIQRRTSEKSTCSLCFSGLPPAHLLPACRRRGCHQRICESCLQKWYGINKPGHIINTATLFCPFCRRAPAARTLAAYGMGIHAVGDLAKAVEERGSWIHAWCRDCGRARRLMERECARGAPEPISDWDCEACQVAAQERARLAEEEARLALELLDFADAADRAEAQARLDAARKERMKLGPMVKKCPGCKTPTQKSYGCDHLECTMAGCGVHWCWACERGFESAEETYEHMEGVHGGLYAGGMGEDEGVDADWV